VLQHLLEGQAPRQPVLGGGGHGVLHDGAPQRGQLEEGAWGDQGRAGQSMDRLHQELDRQV
jgi:hypothetical protein